MEFNFPALGTHWWIEIWDKIDKDTQREVSNFIALFVSNFEKKYSRFISDSDISRLNKERILESPDLETYNILMHGIDLYVRTNGVFNILVGHILESQGYDAEYSFRENQDVVRKAGDPNQDIFISKSRIQLQGSANIDIGGYGKGWLIDLLAKELQDRFNISQLLINGGGDIYTTSQGENPVEIYLEDPQEAQKIISSVKIKNRGFAASSPHKRSWPSETKDEHGISKDHTHIVSQTKNEIKDIMYVTASNAVDADAFATAFLQMDSEQASKVARRENIEILDYLK